jgi:NADH-quinone oxidoreductase subunit C
VNRPPPPGVTSGERDRHERLHGLIGGKFGSNLISLQLDLGDVVAVVHPDRFLDLVSILKLDSELQFNLLLSVTAVDWMDARPERFEAVYHFLSTTHLHRVRVKVPLPESKPVVKSLYSLYPGANFMEREAWDMLGIQFDGHPDLRRVLMYEEFVGHPLRKDYPVQGKQPRIPLRYPEVHNTARDMNRPGLYAINPKRAQRSSDGESQGVRS